MLPTALIKFSYFDFNVLPLYDCQAFVNRIAATVGFAAVEAIGSTHRHQGHIWTVSFDSLSVKSAFVVAGDFDIGSCRAVIAGSRLNRVTMRLHWVPYYMPMSIREVDEKQDIAGHCSGRQFTVYTAHFLLIGLYIL